MALESAWTGAPESDLAGSCLPRALALAWAEALARRGRGRLRRRWRSWLRRGRRSWLRSRFGGYLRSWLWRIVMFLRMIRRCNLRKRTRIHPDDIASGPPNLPAREIKQRRNEQDVKGGDENQIPPEMRVTHESRQEDRRQDAEYSQRDHSSPPCCPPSRRVITPTRPIPTRFRMSITSMNF